MINKLIDLLPIINCQEATRLTSLSMERRLSIKETIDLRLHLMLCSLCVQFQRQIHLLHTLMKNYPKIGEKQLPAETKIKIKKSLQS